MAHTAFRCVQTLAASRLDSRTPEASDLRRRGTGLGPRGSLDEALRTVGLLTEHIMTTLGALPLSPHGLWYALPHCGAVHYRFVQPLATQGSG